MKKIYTIVATVALASVGSVSAVADVISTLPASAEVKTYARAANLFTTFWGATFPQEEDMLPGKVAFDGNTVYMLDPVDGFNAYLKGELEGNTIRFEFPQQISPKWYVNRMVNVPQEDGKFAYEVQADEPNAITFTVDGNGNIKMSGGDDFDVIMGVSDSDGNWSSRGAYGIFLSPFDMTLVEAPDNLQTTTYVLTRDGNSRNVEAGFSGSDFYVKGLGELLPDAWAKGTLSAGKVSFGSGQYMGIDPRLGYLLSMYGVTPGTKDFEPAFVMTYDGESGALKAENDLLLCPDEALSSMLSFEVEANISMVPYKETDDFTPAMPQITDVVVYPQYPDEGWDYIDVNLSIVSEDGQLLDTDNLYYRILLDGEPYILQPEDFEGLDAPMEWIPYDFESYDLEHIGGTGRSVSIYKSFVSTYSVQEKYVNGDKEFLSKIANWSLSKVDDVKTGEKVSEYYTDLLGRRVDNPSNGIFVRTSVYQGGVAVSKTVILK